MFCVKSNWKNPFKSSSQIIISSITIGSCGEGSVTRSNSTVLKQDVKIFSALTKSVCSLGTILSYGLTSGLTAFCASANVSK